MSEAMDESRPDKADHPRQMLGAFSLEDVVWGIAAALFSCILRYCSDLQDALLAISAVRRMAVWALSPNSVQQLIDDAVTEVRGRSSATPSALLAQLVQKMSD